MRVKGLFLIASVMLFTGRVKLVLGMTHSEAVDHWLGDWWTSVGKQQSCSVWDEDSCGGITLQGAREGGTFIFYS